MSETGGVAVLIGEDEESEKQWSFSNDPQGRGSWLEEVAELSEVNLVLETTESFSERVVCEARAGGFGVYVVATTALKYFRRSEGYEDKRDALDAYLLGLMGSRGLRAVRAGVVRAAAESKLLGLTRLRQRLVDLRVELGQKLRAVLLRLSPEVVSWDGAKPTSATFLAVLKRWPDLTSLGRARLETVARTVSRAGRYPRGRARTIARALQQWARALEQVDPERRQAASLELSMLRENLELQNRQIRDLEQQIRTTVEAHPRGPALMDVPGIGVITCADALAEALPRARVSTEAQLATYSGLTPASRESGKSKTSRLRNFVNKRLSGTYFNSAVASLQAESIDRDYYEKKKSDFCGHPAAHVKAVIALARQRHKVIYKILRGEDYDPVRLARSTLARQRSQTHVSRSRTGARVTCGS